MIAAFFGTVISLERAVAVGFNWAYLAPLTAGLGGIALLAGLPVAVSGTTNERIVAHVKVQRV